MRTSRRLLAAALTLALFTAACSSNRNAAENDEPEAESPDGPTAGVASGGSSSGSGFGLEFFGDTGSSAQQGLTATGRASSVVPASRAVVVVDIEPRGSFLAIGGAGGQLSAEQRKVVTDALSPLGISADSVRFGGRSQYGAPRVLVDLPAAAAPTTGQQAIDALDRALGRSLNSGVAFVASDCAPTVSTLQRQAFQDAEAKARQLADSGSLRLGPVVAVAPLTARDDLPFPPAASVDPCDPASLESAVGLNLQPPDAKAEAEVSVAVNVTWSLVGAPAPVGGRPEVTAVGRGSSTANADEAYVIVVFTEDSGADPGPLSQRRRNELERALTALGIARDDIDIATANDYGPVTIVQVETKVADVEKRGEDVRRASEKVLGRSEVAGVRFGSSDCAGALAKARRQAVADAKTRATALAEAAGVRMGDVQAVAEPAAAFGVDPCEDDAESLLRSDDYAAAIQDFDAKPEFRVDTAVRVSWSLAS